MKYTYIKNKKLENKNIFNLYKYKFNSFHIYKEFESKKDFKYIKSILKNINKVNIINHFNFNIEEIKKKSNEDNLFLSIMVILNILKNNTSISLKELNENENQIKKLFFNLFSQNKYFLSLKITNQQIKDIKNVYFKSDNDKKELYKLFYLLYLSISKNNEKLELIKNTNLNKEILSLKYLLDNNVFGHQNEFINNIIHETTTNEISRFLNLTLSERIIKNKEEIDNFRNKICNENFNLINKSEDLSEFKKFLNKIYNEKKLSLKEFIYINNFLIKNKKEFNLDYENIEKDDIYLQNILRTKVLFNQITQNILFNTIFVIETLKYYTLSNKYEYIFNSLDKKINNINFNDERFKKLKKYSNIFKEKHREKIINNFDISSFKNEKCLYWIILHNKILEFLLVNLEYINEENIGDLISKLLINKHEFLQTNNIKLNSYIKDVKYKKINNEYKNIKVELNSKSVKKFKENIFNEGYFNSDFKRVVKIIDNIIPDIFIKKHEGGKQNKYNIKDLKKQFPNFLKITKELSKSRINSNYKKPIIIIGKEGMGKTLYVEKLAKVFQVEIETINVGNLSLNREIVGVNSAWQEAQPGKIYSAYKKHKNKQIVFLLDNFDLLKEDKENDIVNYNYLNHDIFLQVLDKKKAKSFKDMYIDKEIDITSMFFILTANNIDKINPQILKCCDVFEIDEIENINNKKYKNVCKQIFNEIINEEEIIIRNNKELKYINKNIIKELIHIKNKKENINYSLIGELYRKVVLQYINNKNIKKFEINIQKDIENIKTANIKQLKKNFNFIYPSKINVNFSSVYGNEETKEYLKDFLYIYKEQINQNTKELVTDPLKGIILYGKPGVGKTMLAKAFAKECSVPFISLSGNSFKKKYLGEGKETVKELFSIANKNAPCVIYIDEIDALGNRDDNKNDDGVINELLISMDGIEENNNIIVIASTNYIERLDNALIRSGRFDKKIEVKLPIFKERVEIISSMIKEFNRKKKIFSDNINVERVAHFTSGCSGADLRNILNTSIIIKKRIENKTKTYKNIKIKNGLINQKIIDEAIEEIDLGFKTTKFNDKKEKLITAYHEAGHAAISYLINGKYSVKKVTVTPRSNALGLTFITEDKENMSPNSIEDMLKHMCVSFGGMCAEKLLKNYENTGASSDIDGITNTAQLMVKKYGFIIYDEILKDAHINFYNDYERLSGFIKEKLDMEIINIVKQQKKECLKIIVQNKKFIKEIAKELYKKEVINDNDIKVIAERNGLRKNLYKWSIDKIKYVKN